MSAMTRRSSASTSHENENRRLWHYEVRLALECDLDGGFPEEQRLIDQFRLQRWLLHVGAVDLPGFLIHAGRFGHGRPRPGGDDPAFLHLSALEHRRREIEPDRRALLTLGGRDEHAVADDDQPLRVIRHTR